LIARNPCKGIKVKVPPPEKLVLNHDEVIKLLSEAKRTHHHFYYQWAFVLFSGLRNGELYGLRWNDVDLVTGNITLRGQWTNKDGHHSTKSNRSH
jgi:integrase